jgi:hypothetical protein
MRCVNPVAVSGLIAFNPKLSTTIGRGGGPGPLTRPLLFPAESPPPLDTAVAEIDEQLSIVVNTCSTYC